MKNEDFIAKLETCESITYLLMMDNSVKYDSSLYAFLQMSNFALSSALRRYKEVD